MAEYLNHEELEAIRRWPTCAVSNAIELFNIRPRNGGFMLPEIKCIYPEMSPMIGYAVTAVISADSPEGHQVPRPDWWKEILKVPAPRVVVVHDIDNPVVGSLWGEVNANVHKALGCVGTVTDGSVRDLDEVRGVGFHFFFELCNGFSRLCPYGRHRDSSQGRWLDGEAGRPAHG